MEAAGLPKQRRAGTRVVACVRIVAALSGLLLASCASLPHHPRVHDVDALRSRALTQLDRGLRVSTAVPSQEETEILFGLDLYSRGVQPVWVEIENRTDQPLRFAASSVDREYYSPYEVAYVNRGGYSSEARESMNRTFDEASLQRWIPPQSTRSGFVFTHLRPGTKGFNVDVFGDPGNDYSFTFFAQVPGVVPDHAEMAFDSLYSPDEVRRVDLDGLRRALLDLPCCTSDAAGADESYPLNVVLIGQGDDVLHSLLRAGFVETPSVKGSASKSQHLFGRPADAVFRLPRGKSRERNELRLWLTPLRIGDEEVWLAQISHYLGAPTLGQGLFEARLDPDFDDARNYVMQRIWYSQGLERFAWSASGKTQPRSEKPVLFTPEAYFSDGYRVALWLSDAAVSQLETDYVHWDEAPPR
jgi:hypothetical protein